MASQHRSSSYTNEEDLHICHVYLDISQNPIVGINQSKDQFWARIEYDYNNPQSEFTITQARPKRSLQFRMQVILTAVGKLRGCIRQIENLNPSGASEQDILNRAKTLLTQDAKYQKGFKFDHVWPIIKDIEKFASVNNPTSTFQRQIGNFASSQSESPTSESPTSATPGLSDFSLNINNEEIGGSSAERPIGVKKAKLKRKNDEQLATVLDTIKGENQQLVEILKKGNLDRQQNFDQNYQLQMQKIAASVFKEENKILYMDLNSIANLNVREFTRNEKLRIMQKRAQEQGLGAGSQGQGSQGQGSQNNSHDFGQYYNIMRGSGNNFPEY
ncbi:hypothetical protein UlMin_039743 [Ulmus minor]